MACQVSMMLVQMHMGSSYACARPRPRGVGEAGRRHDLAVVRWFRQLVRR